MLICGIEFKSSETVSCAKGVIIKEKTKITVFCHLHDNNQRKNKKTEKIFRTYFLVIYQSLCKSSDNARCSRGVTLKERIKMRLFAIFLKS